MHVFIVYCHPCENSFTFEVKNEFIRGLADAGHSYEVSDLYKMGFNAEYSEREYLRDAFYTIGGIVDADVLCEQRKIEAADAITFIYPVFWTEAPAKLVGWFSRVWTCGWAYGPRPSMKRLEKALFIAIAGKTAEALNVTGEAQAMAAVMLGDRIRDRAKQKEMVIFDSMARSDIEARSANAPAHLKKAYDLGRNMQTIETGCSCSPTEYGI